MKRRQLLICIPTGLITLSGCSSQSQDDGISLEKYSIDSLNRECVDQNSNSARISTLPESSTVNIKGSFAVPKHCVDITTSVLVPATEQNGEVTVFVLAEEQNNTNCQECTAEVEYEAVFNFNRMPRIITLIHRIPGDTPTDIFEKSERLGSDV